MSVHDKEQDWGLQVSQATSGRDPADCHMLPLGVEGERGQIGWDAVFLSRCDRWAAGKEVTRTGKKESD